MEPIKPRMFKTFHWNPILNLSPGTNSMDVCWSNLLMVLLYVLGCLTTLSFNLCKFSPYSMVYWFKPPAVIWDMLIVWWIFDKNHLHNISTFWVANWGLVVDGQKLEWHDCKRVLVNITVKAQFLEHPMIVVVNSLLTCKLMWGMILPFLKMLSIICFVLKCVLHLSQMLSKTQTYT